MANGIDWFRWHHGSVNDPKFGLVAKKAGARVGDVIAVWALVLELASANVERGECGPIDHEATDFLLGAEDGTTARILEAMDGRGLITEGRVARWEDRQPKRERVDTTAAERKRQQRERDSGKGGEADGVTPCHTTSHQVTPREEKSREEKIKLKAKSKAEAAPASRLPADWAPTEADIAFCKAERPDLRPSEVADRFRDYWHAIPGAKGQKTDWHATWRNWVRNERRVSSHGPPAAFQTSNDKAKAWADSLTGKNRSHEPDNRIIDLNDAPSRKLG